MLENIDRAQLVKWVAYYLIIGGILGICFGGLAGAIGLGTGVMFEAPELNEMSDGLAVVNARVAAIRTLIFVAGIASIILGPVMIAVSVGLLQKRSWARMGTVIVVAVNLIVLLLLSFGGSGLLEILLAVIDAVIIYLFLTDPRIKTELGAA
ncbi:MAG TPA: hypothetical protein VKY59_17120 [Spirillospora sp.]|nr:hypothetical protein [Spirillospora sp.]